MRHLSTYDLLRMHGVDRRTFLKFCTTTAASLGLGPALVPRVVQALETKPRLPVIWLHGLECTCCSESFIRSLPPHRPGRAPEHDLAGLRRHPSGGRRVPGGRDPEEDDEGAQGQLHSRGGRQRTHAGWRRLLHCRGGDVPRHSQGFGRRRQGGDCLGLVRIERLRAGGAAEPDGREAGARDPDRTSP